MTGNAKKEEGNELIKKMGIREKVEKRGYREEESEEEDAKNVSTYGNIYTLLVREREKERERWK